MATSTTQAAPRRRDWRRQEVTGRGLRRTGLYLDAQDRGYLARLSETLGMTASQVLRLALRTLAHKYGLTRSKATGR